MAIEHETFKDGGFKYMLLKLKSRLVDLLTAKQDTLVSGTNIKTINNQSLLGSGNIDVSGGGGSDIFVATVGQTAKQDLIDAITDNKAIFIKDSNNEPTYVAVENYYYNPQSLALLLHCFIHYFEAENDRSKVYAISGTKTWNIFTDIVLAKNSDLANKQNKLVSGTNIKTVNNESLLGSGNIDITGGDVDTVMSDSSENAVQNKVIKSYVDTGLSGKQDTLVSGTNIKTINGEDILGSGNITTEYTITYGADTYAGIKEKLSADDRAVIIKDVPYNSDNLTVLVNCWEDTGSAIEIESIVTAQGDLCDVDITIDTSNNWSITFTSRDPFMLLDFNQQINTQIPYCTEDIANTQIPNVDITINDTLGADWAIASLAKYEVFDAASGGNRINCWPVCQFSMSGQKTLRLRMMCAGSSRKTARRISGAILLKHR